MPLQIALFVAAVAIVVFVVFCIPVAIRLCQHADRMAQTLAELKVEMSLLMQDSRNVLANLNELSRRAHAQCDDVEQVIQTVRGWTERVDYVVEEVGAVLEPPILTVVRNAQIIRKGITKLFQMFLNRNHNQPQKAEY